MLQIFDVKLKMMLPFHQVGQGMNSINPRSGGGGQQIT